MTRMVGIPVAENGASIPGGHRKADGGTKWRTNETHLAGRTCSIQQRRLGVVKDQQSQRQIEALFLGRYYGLDERHAIRFLFLGALRLQECAHG